MNIITVFEKHRLVILCAALGLLVVLLLISVMTLVGESKKKEPEQTEVNISIDPAVFMLPAEPLELPPVTYSRKQKKIWTDTDLQYWYTIPDEEQMKKLHSINESRMKKLWESVP